MPNIKLILEYDGTNFSGWQYQPNLRTIQGEITKAIETVFHEKIHMVHASGRTDAGVHAIAQVASFNTSHEEPDLRKLIFGVSSILRGEVSIKSAEIVSDDFHPRRSAKDKQYRFVILNRPAPPVLDNGRVWHIAQKLDIELMKKEAATIVGVRDFKSFQGHSCQAKSTIKEIYESEFIIDDFPYLTYRVIGSGFLKQMVRNIVGTLVAIGKGTIKNKTILDIIEERDRRCAGPTAQPQGLFLDWVRY